MIRVLLASISSLNVCDLLGSAASRCEIVRVSGARQARRRLADDSFSLLIINSPLEDEMGAELAIQAAERTGAGVLLLVRQSVYAVAADKLEPYGVVVLQKPFNAADAQRASRLLLATSARLQNMKKATLKLRGQIDELKVVYRAKCVLMQYLNMSEHGEQAQQIRSGDGRDQNLRRLGQKSLEKGEKALTSSPRGDII